MGNFAGNIKKTFLWYKNRSQPNYWHHVSNDYEFIFAMQRDVSRPLVCKDMTIGNVLVFPDAVNKYRHIHHAVMNVNVSNFLVHEFGKKGGRILDPFSGMGTTGISALKYGMEYVGIELSKEYAELQEVRLREASKIHGLF